jgi:hypothetical protein
MCISGTGPLLAKSFDVKKNDVASIERIRILAVESLKSSGNAIFDLTADNGVSFARLASRRRIMTPQE